jgi:hypothetical protein
VLSTTPHAAADAPSVRHSLRPLFSEGERIQQSSGASRCGDAGVCLSLRGAIATKQSTFSLRRDGLLRFARNDGGGCRGCLKI